MEGNGVSQGQRQRILIARAVYKDPEFIFLDEATNALDTNNEKEIMEHLHRFYRGRTVVVVAHRLSTVRDADNIVVLDKGRVARRTDGETRNILQIGEEPVGIRQLNDDLPVNHHLQIVYGKRERHRITQ